MQTVNLCLAYCHSRGTGTRHRLSWPWSLDSLFVTIGDNWQPFYCFPCPKESDTERRQNIKVDCGAEIDVNQ